MTLRFHSMVGLMMGAVVLVANPLRAQETKPWTMRMESSLMQIHSDDRAPAGALRLSRALGADGATAVDVGLSASGYLSLDAGIERRLCTRCRIQPFLGGGIGLLGEDGYTGWMVRGTAGLEAPLGSGWVGRVSGQLGSHGGQSGPHMVTIGLGRRFGTRR
jgi:hypothetical protein